jgi:hypothetical protein
MNRIAITIAALSISTGAMAVGIESDQSYGSILYERAHPESNVIQKVNTHKTNSFLGNSGKSYGSVLADLDAPDRPRASTSERGVDSDISVGQKLFMDVNDQL